MWAGRQAAYLNLGLEPKLEGKSSLRELDRRAHTVQQGLNFDHGLPKYAMRPPDVDGARSVQNFLLNKGSRAFVKTTRPLSSPKRHRRDATEMALQ